MSLNIGYHKPLPAAPKKPKLRIRTRRRLRIIRKRTSSLPHSAAICELINSPPTSKTLPKSEEKECDDIISLPIPLLGGSYSDISPKMTKKTKTMIIFDHPLIMFENNPNSSGSGSASDSGSGVFCNFANGIQRYPNMKISKNASIVKTRTYSPAVITPAQTFHMQQKINRLSKPKIIQSSSEFDHNYECYRDSSSRTTPTHITPFFVEIHEEKNMEDNYIYSYQKMEKDKIPIHTPSTNENVQKYHKYRSITHMNFYDYYKTPENVKYQRSLPCSPIKEKLFIPRASSSMIYNKPRLGVSSLPQTPNTPKTVSKVYASEFNIFDETTIEQPCASPSAFPDENYSVRYSNIRAIQSVRNINDDQLPNAPNVLHSSYSQSSINIINHADNSLKMRKQNSCQSSKSRMKQKKHTYKIKVKYKLHNINTENDSSGECSDTPSPTLDCDHPPIIHRLSPKKRSIKKNISQISTHVRFNISQIQSVNGRPQTVRCSPSSNDKTWCRNNPHSAHSPLPLLPKLLVKKKKHRSMLSTTTSPLPITTTDDTMLMDKFPHFPSHSRTFSSNSVSGESSPGSISSLSFSTSDVYSISESTVKSVIGISYSNPNPKLKVNSRRITSPNRELMIKKKKKHRKKRIRKRIKSEDNFTHASDNNGNYNVAIHWVRQELIGVGGFGKVYKGYDKNTGKVLAIKQIPFDPSTLIRNKTNKNKVRRNDILSVMDREATIMKSLTHPNIVQFIDYQKSIKYRTLCILMEYVDGVNLDVLYRQNGALKESLIAIFTKQIMSALKFAHASQVIHRDIKSKNIIVTHLTQQIKLADFGSAKLCDCTLGANAKFQPSLNYNYTPLWTAPEVLIGDYDYKIDVWSVGCVMIEMATAQHPWAERNFQNPFAALYHIGQPNNIPAYPKDLSKDCRDFMRCCLIRDPSKRSSSAKLYKHRFLRKVR